MSAPEIRSYKATERSGTVLAEVRHEKYHYSVGFVTTPHGVVGVYRDETVTLARVVSGGREWRACWNREFTDARLVTECKRFARSVSAPMPSQPQTPGDGDGDE